jgi:hypothetical protein
MGFRFLIAARRNNQIKSQHDRLWLCNADGMEGIVLQANHVGPESEANDPRSLWIKESGTSFHCLALTWNTEIGLMSAAFLSTTSRDGLHSSTARFRVHVTTIVPTGIREMSSQSLISPFSSIEF